MFDIQKVDSYAGKKECVCGNNDTAIGLSGEIEIIEEYGDLVVMGILKEQDSGDYCLFAEGEAGQLRIKINNCPFCGRAL